MVTLDLADTLTIDAGRRRASPSAGRSPPASRPTAPTSSPGRCGSPAAGPPCTSTSRSRTAAGSAAARPTPRRSCAGPGTTTSARPSRLGADVPFCLVGGRARVTRHRRGRRAARRSSRCAVTLVVPPLHVSTPAVYRAWDDLGGPTAAGPNDLEPAALVVEPGAGRAGATASASSPASRRCSPAAGRRGSCPANATTPSHPCGARALRSWSPGRRRRRETGLLAALVAGAAEHLLVLLLAHPLAALLDQRTHTAAEATGRSRDPRDTVARDVRQRPVRGRSTVGHLILVQCIGVRVLSPER